MIAAIPRLSLLPMIQNVPLGPAVSGWHLTIPLVYPAVLSVSATWFVHHRLKRARRRVPCTCASCGYDLRGTTSEVCPECGVATEPAPLGGDGPKG